MFTRRFILTNLKRHPNNHYTWQVDLGGLLNYAESLSDMPVTKSFVYDGNCIGIFGTQSSYYHSSDNVILDYHFPNRQDHFLLTGHNPHIEKPDEVIQILMNLSS